MNNEEVEKKDTHKIAKILLLDRGKVLLLLSKHLNKWHLPGGHLVTGESFMQGIRRELKEETGLNLSWAKIVFSKANFTLYRGGSFYGTVKLSEEHKDKVWVDIEKAHLLDLCDFTRRDIVGLQKAWNKIKDAKVKKKQNSKALMEEIEKTIENSKLCNNI
jgi:8-oxo-dGTP diphosphatase